jgi:hypothetical protein
MPSAINSVAFEQDLKNAFARSLRSRNFSAQIAEKPVLFGDTFCVHSDGYELEGITKRSSPFGNLASKIS